MANILAEMYIEVKAKTDQLEKDLDKLKSSVQSKSTAMSKGFGGVGSTLAKLGLGTLGVASIFNILRKSVTGFVQDARAFAKVTQAVKQTGGAAGFTAKELRKAADSLEKLTNIEADKILNDVTAQLLSFPKITGEVFKRAQVAVLDLATLIDGDMRSSAIQLGKALQDPIKGVNALTRSGVAFTEQQKEQIKTLVESGDILKAQNLVLDEINNQYGGQAAAIANVDGGITKLNISMDAFLDKIGGALIPLISGLTGVFTELVTPAKTASDLFEEQSAKVSLLESNIPALMKRYDELQGKSSLTTEESKELRDIIQKISEYMPTAVTAYNSYGDALDITRSKVNDLLSDEKKLFEQRKQGLIDQLKEEKRLKEIQVGIKTDELNKGESIIDVPFAGPQKAKLQPGDFAETRKELAGLNTEISELSSNIAILEGAASAFDPNSLVPTKPITSGAADGEEQKDFVKDITDKLKELKVEYSQIDEALKKSNITLIERNALIDRQLQLTSELNALQIQSPLAKGGDASKTDLASLVQPVSEIESPLVGVLTDAEKLNLVLEGVGETMYGLADAASFFGSAFGQESAAYKAAAVIQATVATYLAAAKALTLGPIIGPIAAAAVTIAGLANVSKIMSAHTGGTFENGRKVASFARGGDFMVPPGYSNDSFPMLVESGERVQVTPKGAVGNQDKLLSQLISETRAMNRNIVNQSRGDIRLDVDGKELALIVQSNLNRLSSAGFDTQFV